MAHRAYLITSAARRRAATNAGHNEATMPAPSAARAGATAIPHVSRG
ncbi:MAG TPA: hypothetical protein P5118_23265 [Planctomycetota bacterium]|nr:hypothetical protein [Planctomycetota bacterium]